MYRIADLVLIELSGHTYYETQPFFVVLLTEHGSYSGVRGVGVQNLWLVPVLERKENVTHEALFQLLEVPLLCGSPVPDFLPGENGERRRDGSELCEELVI